MKQNYTDITIVLDRSGSMDTIKTDMEGALNSFLEDQKKVAGECKITLVQFNDTPETLFTGKNLSEVEKIKIVPSGMTALNDALGKAIDDSGARFANMAEQDRPEKVMVIVITDGYENASRTVTQDMLRGKITLQKETYKWDFVYLGANQDSFAVAQRIGIDLGKTINYDASADGVRGVSDGLSCYTTSLRCSSVEKSRSVVFSEEARKKAAGKTPAKV